MLETRHLQRNAPDGTSLLRDVSLTISVGDRIAVVGPTGAGKSVLLRALAWLDPSEGELQWRGKPVDPANIPGYRQAVLYLQQVSTLPEGTVEDALREPFAWSIQRAKSFDRETIQSQFKALGRSDSFYSARTQDLSGGETQLVAIVRALQLEPTLLLLDEPTSALDQATSLLVERLLLDWVNLPGHAYVWVTHNTEQAQRISNRILHLRDGEIARHE